MAMATEPVGRFLAEHPFFQGLSAPQLEAIVGCTSPVRFEEGQYLFREGQPADRFFVVRHGRVVIDVYAPGRGAIAIETVTDGEVLGWSWLFPPYRWHFEARALTTVEALSVSAICLRARCESDPVLGLQVTRRFAQVVVQRLESTQLQLLDAYPRHP